MDYKTSGVDVQAGRDFVQRIKSSVESTFRPEVLGGLGGFGGLIRLPKGFTNPVLVAGTDGVGTKLELAQDYQAHFGVGIDLVAMCVNDVITSGAKPLFFLDYIATGSLSLEAMAEVVEGIANGCSLTGCTLLGGETAEMPGFYSKGRYDLAGFCVGIVEESELIDGSNISPGDQIIGIASSGIHSNGFSLIRKVLSSKNVDQTACFGKEKMPLIESLLKPTILYDPLVKGLLAQSIPIKGMSHITGGGLPENLPRCIPKGLIASIDIDSWSRSDVFTWLEKEGDIPLIDLWNTFNMGVGFCLVLEEDRIQEAIKCISALGFESWHMGHIQEKPEFGDKNLIGLPI